MAVEDEGQDRQTDGGNDAQMGELRRQLQQERVERGRLAKANGEAADLRRKLEERDGELADLRKQLEELRGRSEAQRLRDGIDEDLRDRVDDDALLAGATMAHRAGERVREDVEAELDAMRKRLSEVEARSEEERTRPARDSVVQALDQSYPGFVENVDAGGPWADRWTEFLRTKDPETGRPYRERLQASYSAGRVRGVESIVEDFLEDSGLGREPPPAAPREAAASAPAQGAGRGPRTYTPGQYEAALRSLANRYYGGAMSKADYDRERAELTKALDEGRVG